MGWKEKEGKGNPRQGEETKNVVDSDGGAQAPDEKFGRRG